MVREFRLVALRAGYIARSRQFPVGTALVAAGLGHFTLWYCHLISPPVVVHWCVKFNSMQWVDAEWITIDARIYHTCFRRRLQAIFSLFFQGRGVHLWYNKSYNGKETDVILW